jgi:DNA-binding response OmpR family regulator
MSLEFGELVIDDERRVARLAGHAMPLTRGEFLLLWHLASNAGQALTRRHLLDLMRGASYPATDRSIDVHIANLRRKLGAERRHIATVRRGGYVFHASVAEDSTTATAAPEHFETDECCDDCRL